MEEVLERCQRLRFTGRLLLDDGQRQVELLWMGGDLHDPDSGDTTQEIRRWQSGSFQVSQRMPGLQGQLTEGVEISGELSLGQVQRIAKLCSDFRLSADLFLERSTGDRAVVRFTLGHAESAAIGDQPLTALQALALLSVWHKGRFRARLRPLFADDAPEAPIFADKRQARGDFDVTGTIQLPLHAEERRRSEPPGRSRPPREERPPAPEPPAATAPAPERPTVPIPVSAIREAQEQTQSSDLTRTSLSVSSPTRHPWRRAILIGLGGGAVAFLLAVGGRIYLRQLPAPTKLPAMAQPVDLAPAALDATDLRAPPDLRSPPDLTTAPDAQTARSREQQVQLERALRLILEGRWKKAQEAVAQLRKQAPDDAELALVEKQAKGELGRAEIVISGSGPVLVSGHSYSAPHRLRVPAGMYLINGRLVTLQSGDQREIVAGAAP